MQRKRDKISLLLPASPLCYAHRDTKSFLSGCDVWVTLSGKYYRGNLKWMFPRHVFKFSPLLYFTLFKWGSQDTFFKKKLFENQCLNIKGVLRFLPIKPICGCESYFHAAESFELPYLIVAVIAWETLLAEAVIWRQFWLSSNSLALAGTIACVHWSTKKIKSINTI